MVGYGANISPIRTILGNKGWCNEAQAGNIKMAHMFKEKSLEAPSDKTCFIVFGSKGYKENVEKQLEINPLFQGDFPVQRRDSDRYLGWCKGKLCCYKY